MARRIPETRFNDLIRGATAVFIERGYRRTQMADVAQAIGVAKGTLYGYVDGKDALLAACLAMADQAGPLEMPATMPLSNPAPGVLGERVKEALSRKAVPPALEAALSAPFVEDAEGEVREIVGELFDLMYAQRHGIKLLDRCMDHPELEALWQSAGREQVRVAMARYVEMRIEGGDFRSFEDVRLAARFVIESCTTWAVHIHWDRAPESYAPELARQNAIDFIVRGLLE